MLQSRRPETAVHPREPFSHHCSDDGGSPRDWLPRVLATIEFNGTTSDLLDTVARLARLQATGLSDGVQSLRKRPPTKPKTKTKRSLKNSLDELRRQYRESMAQRRRDGRARVKRLQDDERELHTRLRETLRGRRVGTHSRLATYVELVREGEALRDERRTLKTQLKQRRQYTRMVSGETDRLPDLVAEKDEEAEDQHKPQATGAFWIRLVDSEPPLRYERVAPAQRTQTMRAHSQAMAAVRHTLSQLDPRVERAHCIGWYVEHMFAQWTAHAPPMFHFRFTRRVSRERTSLETLQGLTWAMLQSPEQMARSQGTTASAKTVERIDRDAMVLLRTGPGGTASQQLRYFTLDTRSCATDGSSAWIDMAVLDKQPPPPPPLPCKDSSGDDVVWLDRGGACVSFRHVEKHAIEIQYAGFLQCVSDAHAAFLLVESCAALLRWEHAVVPPRLLP